MAENGFVIFAKNIQSMSRFYQATLNLEVSVAEKSHEVLSNGSIELVIHGIPKKIADSIKITNPPEHRENTAIKPAFVVASLDKVRLACTDTGGGLNPVNSIWDIRGAKVLDGWDPEGNIIQFKQFIR